MTSKALINNAIGSINQLLIDDDDLPALEDDMVEVQVHYSSINFADFYTIHQLIPVELPVVLGMECSGIVLKTGAKVDKFMVGDRVICYDKVGLHRKLVRIKQKKCYRIPDDIDLACAAATFVNYLTAWFSLFQQGSVQHNSKIFISSCAGGVGLAAINIVRSLRNGVQIYGTASESKKQFLINECNVVYVDYKQVESLDCFFDLVIESSGTRTRLALMKKLKPFGKLVIIGAKDMIQDGNDDADPNINAIDLIFSNTSVSGLHLGVLAENHPNLIDDALSEIFKCIRQKPPLFKVYNFEDAQEAYRELAERKNIGKLLLKM